MSGTSRRGSTRRALGTEAGAGPVARAVEASSLPAEPAVELLDDRSTSITGGRPARSLGRSLTGAVAATLLVVGLALGAAVGPGGALGPAGDRGDTTGDTAAAGADADAGGGGGGAGSYGGGGSYSGGDDGTKDEYEWGIGPDATDKPDVDGPDATDKPIVVEPTKKPEPETTPKPTEKPYPTKPPTDPSDPIALGLAIKEYHPFMEWGSCEALDFDVYKVVRSTDSTATWPAGENDELIAAVERGGTRKAYDKYAPHGVKVWYRVFCVRKGEDGYKVVNGSATKGIEVPEEPVPPTPPDPITLGLEASLGDGGKVLLDWGACNVDGFVYYKVLRSTTSDDPSYLPWHDGTEVVGVVSEVGSTQLEVWGPDAGTAWYRVQCLGYVGDQKVLLGESAVVAVTAP